MLGQYGDLDIALDPFPFNGGMTTLEALWMGVPVVTLAGTSVVSRQSLAVLENMGVPELIFPDLASYVAGAVALANDRDRLVRLRRELRPRLAASPVCQPEQFTRDLEALYRRMWQAWCAGTRLPGDVAVPGTSGA
jgi:predicted O-linked N-acetylglucosamine transferase (SPINDLY family)